MKNNDSDSAPNRAETKSPMLSLIGLSSSNRSPQRLRSVSNVLHRPTDAELETHIASCTYLMEQAYADYEASGCLGDRGTADRWRILRDEAVRSRSPAQVRQLEKARGLE